MTTFVRSSGASRTMLSGVFALCAICVLNPPAAAHVTLQARGPLAPGRYATILLVVPTERYVPTTQVSIEVPDAFLNAGGRLSRVQPPAGWQVEIVKEDKPGDVYEKEMQERAERDSQRSEGAEHAAGAADPAPGAATAEGQGAGQSEEEIMNEMRKKWIKRIVFSGGSIPPDFFQEFSLSFQLPDQPGEYRFAAVQTYADGEVVSWSELVEGAEHPAATISIPAPPRPAWPMQAAGIVALLLLGILVGRRLGRA